MFVLERMHPKSRFALKTLDGICDCSDIILQVAETNGLYTATGKTAYLCEVVSPKDYSALVTDDGKAAP